LPINEETELIIIEAFLTMCFLLSLFMCPFLGNGERIWDIPWSYRTSSMIQRKVFIQKMPQVMTNIGDKTSTISKNGIAPPPRVIP
jgi:hypothetical protein